MMADRREILEMVASGKLSAQEAADLLTNVGKVAAEPVVTKTDVVVEVEEPVKADAFPVYEKIEVEEEEEPVKKTKPAGGKSPKWLHVRVSDARTGKKKVTVNVPLGLLKVGLKLGGGFVPELGGVDVDELTAAIAEEGSGMLVDVMDEADGHHVQVYVD